MMESIFSFLPSYFSIIVLAKGKISKSVSLFLSQIGLKLCWLIRLQDFESKISLEQSDEIVYFLPEMLIPDLIEKYWRGCGQKWLWPPWSQGEWMNEWMNGADFLHAEADSGKVRMTFIIFVCLWLKMGMRLYFQWMDKSS